MFENRKNSKLKKLAVMGTTLALVLSLSAAAFADNQPGNGGNPGGMGGQQPGFEQTSPAGGAENTDRNTNAQMPGNENPQQGNAAAPGAGSAQDMDSNRVDMTPPENADAEPGEDVPAKPENDNQQNNNQQTDKEQEKPEGQNETDPMRAPDSKPQDKPDGQTGIDLKAVEAYMQQAGDSVDANVKSAYDALSEALAAEPEQDGENDNIATLESALTEALENAEVDLTTYEQVPEAPAEPAEGSDAAPQDRPENNGETQPDGAPETTESSETSTNGFMNLLNRFIDFLRNL